MWADGVVQIVKFSDSLCLQMLAEIKKEKKKKVDSELIFISHEMTLDLLKKKKIVIFVFEYLIINFDLLII